MILRRVLYPTDFSRCAKHALTYAVSLAERFGAELYILHAISLHHKDPSNPAYHFRDLDEIHRRTQEFAASEMLKLVEDEDTHLTIYQVDRRGEYAGPVIIGYAREIGADLIAMGTHGGRAAHLRLGSVADEVIRSAPCPVLTLRELEEPRTLGALRRILVPLDFSADSRRALLYATELARRFDAHLQILHVIETVSHPEFYSVAVPQKRERIEREFVKALAGWMDEAEGPQVPFESHMAVGRPAMEITGFADQHGSDLIVIASHGLTAGDDLAIGSTAERVVRLSQCPVLIVRAGTK